MRKIRKFVHSIRKIGPVQQKILLLLEAGLALSLVYSPRRQFRIIRGIGKEWDEIEQRSLAMAIRRLYESEVLQEKHHADGTISLVLSKSGKRMTLRYNLDKMRIAHPRSWDKKWRIVLFDIPETQRKLRDAFRGHLKRLGFYEFQKSVFIHPYECNAELDFIIEYYNARKFIRYIVAEKIDNLIDVRRNFTYLH